MLSPGLGTEGDGTLEKTGSLLLSCRKAPSHPVHQYFPGVQHGTGVELVNAVKEGQGVHSEAVRKEGGSWERQVEIMVTLTQGLLKRSEGESIYGKMRYMEGESRRYK